MKYPSQRALQQGIKHQKREEQNPVRISSAHVISTLRDIRFRHENHEQHNNTQGNNPFLFSGKNARVTRRRKEDARGDQNTQAERPLF